MLGWRVKETDGKRVRYLLYIEPTPLSRSFVWIFIGESRGYSRSVDRETPNWQGDGPSASNGLIYQSPGGNEGTSRLASILQTL